MLLSEEDISINTEVRHKIVSGWLVFLGIGVDSPQVAEFVLSLGDMSLSIFDVVVLSEVGHIVISGWLILLSIRIQVPFMVEFNLLITDMLLSDGDVVVHPKIWDVVVDRIAKFLGWLVLVSIHPRPQWFPIDSSRGTKKCHCSCFEHF